MTQLWVCALLKAGARPHTAFPYDLDDRRRPPAVSGPRKEVGLRPHPAVVRPERDQQRLAERDLAIASALAAFDAQHHAPTVDVADLEIAELGTPQPGAIEREQHRPVIKILRPADEPLDLVRAQDDRQSLAPLRVRQVFIHIPPPQDVPTENRSAHTWVTTVSTQTRLLKQGQVILPMASGPAGRAAHRRATKSSTCGRSSDRGRGVLAPHELVVQLFSSLVTGNTYVDQPTPLRITRPPVGPPRPASFKSRRVEE